ncbi:MAG: PDZ domain-containing protein [Polyangiales bacterium]
MATALWLMCLVGCSPYDDLRLFDVDAVEPAQIEPGGKLRILGDGFPLGLTPEIILEGELYRPGLPPTHVDARLTAEVENETRIEVEIDQAWMRELGGRGTFEGTMRLAFRAAAGRRDVFADYPLFLDFLPDTSTVLGVEAVEDTSNPLIDASHFGVVLSREESGGVGVQVESVTPGGAADRQGVRSGDIVVGLDGLRLYSWRDFLPDPTQTQSQVSVARKDLAGVHVLYWPHEVTAVRAGVAVQLVMLCLGLLLGWRSPMLLGLRRQGRASTEAWLTRASLILVFAAGLFCVAALQSLPVWILALGAFAALVSHATGEREAGASFGYALVSTLVIMWIAGTADLGTLVAAQSSNPTDWHAFRAPASTFACIGFLVALGPMAGHERLSASLYVAAASVIGAAVFFGGWAADSPIEAIAGLAAKAAAIAIASRSIHMTHKATATVLGLAGVCALGVTWAGRDPMATYWPPLVLGAMIALLVRASVPLLHRQSLPAVA